MALILFDGICNLCNSGVNFVIDRDKKGKYKFASLQSKEAQEILSKHGVQTPKMDSFILIKQNKVYRKSSAILEISKDMGSFWPILYVFKIVPTFFRNWIYNFVAAHRYQWFGKRDQCRIPTEELQNRFLKSLNVGPETKT